MHTALRFSAPVLAAASLAACVSSNAPLPSYLFSLTAWTAGRDVELLLLNVTDRPIRAVNNVADSVSIELKDETGASVTNGFIRYNPDPPTPRAGQARRLGSQKVFRRILPSEAIVRRVEAQTGAPLDRARRYRIGFESQSPVVGPDGVLLFARVQSRSNCTLFFDGGRATVNCGSG